MDGCYKWLLSAALFSITAAVDFNNMTRREVLIRLLNSSTNDPRIPPDYDKDVPTNVTIQMHIVSFHSVNEVSMVKYDCVNEDVDNLRVDFTMTFYLRRMWMDERLAFPAAFHMSDMLELDTRLIDRLWVPDIFFRNEKTAHVHNVTVPNRLLHLYRNGTVMYSSRLSMTLSCPMDLLLFPMDVQVCPIIIQSYAYSTSNVVFKWMAGNSITKAKDWEMAYFLENGLRTHDCSHVFDDNFACVSASFRLQRQLAYFLVHVYLPTVLVVILSWISFWIDAGATPARITIGVMSVLTMATQSSSIQTVLPRVSYVKAIDVWMAVCTVFVFSALLEFAYVNVLNRRMIHFNQALGNVKRVTQNDQVTDVKGVTVDASETLQYPGPEPRKVDKISRCLFPTLFLLFVLTYWVVYSVLNSRQAQDFP